MITKLLCKYLDSDGKGYVTMGDLIIGTVVSAGLLLLLVMYVHGAIMEVEYYTSVRVAGGTLSPFEEVSAAVFFVATCFVICAVVATICFAILIGLVEIWDIAIVKCERKDEDDPNEST